MGQTIAEKILSKHAGHQVKPGELIISDIDVVMVQDGTGPLAVNEFKKMGKINYLTLKEQFFLLTTQHQVQEKNSQIPIMF